MHIEVVWLVENAVSIIWPVTKRNVAVNVEIFALYRTGSPLTATSPGLPRTGPVCCQLIGRDVDSKIWIGIKSIQPVRFCSAAHSIGRKTGASLCYCCG